MRCSVTHSRAICLDEILFKVETAVGQLVLDGGDEDEAETTARLEVAEELGGDARHNFAVLRQSIEAEKVVATL